MNQVRYLDLACPTVWLIVSLTLPPRLFPAWRLTLTSNRSIASSRGKCPALDSSSSLATLDLAFGCQLGQYPFWRSHCGQCCKYLERIATGSDLCDGEAFQPCCGACSEPPVPPIG